MKKLILLSLVCLGMISNAQAGFTEYKVALSNATTIEALNAIAPGTIGYGKYGVTRGDKVKAQSAYNERLAELKSGNGAPKPPTPTGDAAQLAKDIQDFADDVKTFKTKATAAGGPVAAAAAKL